MNYLMEFGISKKNLKNMLEVNYDIINLTDEEIRAMIFLLKQIGCNEKIINNIITANPQYLSRNKKDVIALINKLNDLGVTRLDVTLDTNPQILNYDSYELDEFIKEKINEGLELSTIIDLIDAGEVE